MRSNITAIAAFVAALVLAGCSSGTIKITTNPSGADVWVKTVGQTERRNVGKTPLASTKFSEFQKGTGGAVSVELEKQGFLTSTVLIPEAGNANIEILQELKPATADETAKNAALNKSLDSMFEAQRLARAGRMDDALKILDQVGKDQPQVSLVRELRAGIYYVKKDYPKALDEYRNAVLLNADNASAQSMVKKLEAKLGTAAKPAAEKNPGK